MHLYGQLVIRRAVRGDVTPMYGRVSMWLLRAINWPRSTAIGIDITYICIYVYICNVSGLLYKILLTFDFEHLNSIRRKRY